MLKVKNKITVRNRAGLEALDSLRDLGYDFNDNGEITSAADESYERMMRNKYEQMYNPHYYEEKQRNDTYNSIIEAQQNDKLYNFFGKMADNMNDFRHTAAAILTANPATFIPGAMWSTLNLGLDYAHGDIRGIRRTITDPVMFYGLGKVFSAIPKVAKFTSKLFKGSNPVSKAVNERVVVPDNTPEFNKTIPYVNSTVEWSILNPFIFPSKK